MTPIDPFQRQLYLYEKKAKLATTISKMTKGRGRKYVKFSDLKGELGVDDAGFDEIMSGARKANRHSNKYIFTQVDEEPAIGITASKRRSSKKKKNPEETQPHAAAQPAIPTSPKDKVDYNMNHHEYRGEPVQGTLMHHPPAKERIKESRAYHHRSEELWRIMHRDGWRGLDRLDILPEGWQKMSDNEIVSSILYEEFKND